MPAHIHYAAHAAWVIDHDRRIVLYRIVMNHIGKRSHRPNRLPKQKIRNVNAMGSDIVERSPSRLRRIKKPPPKTPLVCAPFMAGKFREDWPSVRSSFQQLLRPLHLRISPAIVS